MQQRRDSRPRRRSVLAVGATGLAALAGCIDAPFGDSGPESRTYTITLEDDGGEITATVDPSGDVEDVIQVQVGDEVTFEVENRRDDSTVFHNHVPREKTTIPAGTTAKSTFTPTEERIGTHVVEVFDAHGTGESDDHHDGTEDGHDGTEDGHDGTEDGHDDGHDSEDVSVILTIEVRPAGS